jgi:hypothetical protein
MLHDVEAVPSEPAALTIIDGQRAVTEIRVERDAENGGVKAIDPDDLPGELAAGAEAADIAFEAELLAGRDLMTRAPTTGSTHSRSFERATATRRERLILRPSRSKSAVSVPVRLSETLTSWFQ